MADEQERIELPKECQFPDLCGKHGECEHWLRHHIGCVAAAQEQPAEPEPQPEPVTCVRCQQVIEDAEYLTGADGPRHLSCPVKRGRGRPRIAPREMHRFTVRVPAELWIRIEAQAGQGGLNDWAVAAFAAALARPSLDDEAPPR